MPTPAELNTHIVNDPNGRGFAALVTAGNWQGIADLLNDPAFSTLDDFRYTPQEIQDAIDTGELTALTDTAQRALQMVFSVAASGGRIDFSEGTSGRDWMFQIFGHTPQTPSNTVANLAAAASRPASEAEITWGIDTRIGWQQVAEAMA